MARRSSGSAAKPRSVPAATILSQLIHPLTSREFLEKSYWSERFFVRAEPVAWVRENLAVPDLRNLRAIERWWTGDVDVWNKEHGASTMPFSQALKYYARGDSLYLRSARKRLALLDEAAHSLERELGLASGTCVVELFASRPGSGAALHFDSDWAFNIQLHGSKRWWLRRNDHFESPTAPFVPKRTSREPDGVLARQRIGRGPIPLKMPAGAHRADVGPGSVVWFPRGTWHTTLVTGTEDSLSVIFALRPPTWAEVISAALKDRLLQNRDLREPFFALGDVHAQRATLVELIEQTRDALGRLDVGDLVARNLPAYLDPAWVVAPNEGVRSKLVDGSDTVDVEVSGTRLPLQLLAPAEARLAHALLSRPGPRPATTMGAEFGIRPERVVTILQTLVAAGLITRTKVRDDGPRAASGRENRPKARRPAVFHRGV